MPTIKILPHPTLCPTGAELQAKSGDNLIRLLLDHGIMIDHACEMQCACTTCHVYVRDGLTSLATAKDQEEDMLDKAWGLDLDSRLSCQTIVGHSDLVIEIPKYTLNLVSES